MHYGLGGPNMTRMLTALVAAFAMGGACAQAPMGTEPVSPATASPADGNAANPVSTGNACCRVPGNTVVDLEILDLLNSAERERGDKFRFRVVAPVMAGDTVLIAAGTAGVGEIVHAAAARGGGAPGELLIAARSLDVDGQTVALRGLKLGVTGGDNSGMALGVAFAAGPFAMFIRGQEIEIPAGTRVNAKVAQDVTLAPARTQSPPTATSTKE